MSRTDVFEATGPTSGTHVSVKLGATKDGRLVAGEAHLIYEAGAFPGSPMPSACQGMMGPYDIPNVWIEGFDVVVNKPKSAAYRAPGVPAAAFTVETAIDIGPHAQSGDSSELASRFPCKGKSVRNRGVSQTMPFLVIPRSLLRGGFMCAGQVHVLGGCKSLCQPDGGEGKRNARASP
jgi:xanthine dehydrogenase molybdopterin-binding subunit B